MTVQGTIVRSAVWNSGCFCLGSYIWQHFLGGGGTFPGTNFFRYRFQDFFQYNFFLIPQKNEKVPGTGTSHSFCQLPFSRVKLCGNIIMCFILDEPFLIGCFMMEESSLSGQTSQDTPHSKL